VGIMGSDVCFAPTTSLMTLLSQTGTTGLPADTLSYYLQCGANPGMAPIGALDLIAQNSGQLTTAATQAQSLADQVAANPSAPGLAPLSNPSLTYHPSDMASGLNNANSALGSVSAALACTPIDALISTLFTGLCNDGISTMIALFKILIAAAVLLVIQLGIGVDLCCYHPGHAAAWEEDEAGGAPAAGKGGIELTGANKPGLVLATPAGGYAVAVPVHGQGARV
jgi:hypothetical protein